jgi:hypothetical protein
MTAIYADAGGPMPVRHSLIQSWLRALCQKTLIALAVNAAVEATYDFFSCRFEPIPRTSLDGIKHILKEMDAPQRNPADFLDRTLLDEIEKEDAEPKLR